MSQEQQGAQPSSGATGKAQIRTGVHTRDIPANLTVKQIREQFGQMYRIPTDAQAYSGTEMLGEDAIVGEGQSIEWVKKAGEKGNS